MRKLGLRDSPDEHIPNAELAKLLEKSRGRREPVLDRSDVHPHLAGCPACRQQFEELVLLDRQLKSMRMAEPALLEGDCPDPSVWREIAGGLTPPGETLAHVEHASRCDHCGPQLRRAVAELSDLNGEITDAERKHIAILESARADWQRQLAQQITGTPPSRPSEES